MKYIEILLLFYFFGSSLQIRYNPATHSVKSPSYRTSSLVTSVLLKSLLDIRVHVHVSIPHLLNTKLTKINFGSFPQYYFVLENPNSLMMLHKPRAYKWDFAVYYLSMLNRKKATCLVISCQRVIRKQKKVRT